VNLIKEGAAEPVRLALLPPDGPTGGFFGQVWTIPLVIRDLSLAVASSLFLGIRRV
jgi:hypothetical protein